MLQTQAVAPGLLGLIRKLQSFDSLSGFSLAGGTGLALLIGHRHSVDIDLFSQSPFDTETMVESLEQNFGFRLHFSARNTIKGIIEGIMVDIITHAYPLVDKIIVADGVMLYSKKDIAAMKVNAITGNGTRAKDFVDLYFLLHEFSLEEILQFYGQKYALRNDFHALKSICYFADIDVSAWPKMILEPGLRLPAVKKFLQKKQIEYLKQFPTKQQE